jgi:nitrite reductase/ring-hydroxylating ferredoxin subunit
MELPDSVKAIGAQRETGGDIAPAQELFEAYDVFAAELAQIFTQPWLAVDHASRLAEDGDYVRADVGSRSVVLVRETADQIHALRNACLHAGYRVCEAEGGRAQHLYCQYHGWYYALDGRLTDPLLQPRMTDRSRFRLPRFAMQISRGLILVDLSKVAPEPPPAGPVELGPLSFVAIRNGDAALVRLIPRFPGQTEFELVLMPEAGAAADADPYGAVLAEHGDGIAAAPLDRRFYDWYWPFMAPAGTAD